ncbi:MAG: YihY family inner membrane protein [Methylococcales bacterium]
MRSKIQFWLGRLFLVFDDDISFFAASLSFYSVLSIIPMLWVLFFILHQLGVFQEYFDLVKVFLVDSLIPSHAKTITKYLEGFMSNAGRMGSVGLIYIVIASVLFYRNYQYVVNKIFLVPNHSLLHSLATYLVLAFLMPATLGLSFYLSDYIQQITGEGHAIMGEFAVLSYFMIWMLFFVLFKVSPNMQIDIRIALKVSFFVSLVWHVAKWMFVQYTIVNQTFNTLYGSFSAILFLLVWIYLSWLLLLHGLKACYLMHCHYGKYA